MRWAMPGTMISVFHITLYVPAKRGSTRVARTIEMPVVEVFQETKVVIPQCATVDAYLDELVNNLASSRSVSNPAET